MTEQTTQSRSRIKTVLAIVWVLLISAIALVDRVAVGHLTQRVHENVPYHQLLLASLEEKLTALERELETLRRAPNQVSEEVFTEARRALGDRLDGIDAAVREAALARDLVPLQERLSAVEARLSRLTRAASSVAPARMPAAVPTETAPPDPPFMVLGIEWRAGKPFLSVAPAGAYSLDAVRVMQPGDAYEDWQLESLDGNTVIFRVAGRAQRITIP